MKRIICMLLAMTMLCALSACGAEKQSVTSILPMDYYALEVKYIRPLSATGIIGTAWDKADTLKPEYFVGYYACVFLLSGKTFELDEENSLYIPQDELEATVQSRFDVSTEYLRTGANYKAEKEAYEFVGIASTSVHKITAAEQNDKLLTIQYGNFDALDQLRAQGKLTVEINGEDFKYLSNEFESLN